MNSKFFLKSKTINFNTLYLALIGVLQAAGIDLPETVVAAGGVILNYILRYFTDQGIYIKE